MNSYESFFHSELIKLLRLQRKDYLENLERRVPHEEYLVRVGYLQALRWLEEDACPDVEKKLKSG